jgi:hypothetical protein
MFSRLAEAYQGVPSLGPLQNQANAPGLGNRLLAVTQTVDDLDFL